MTTTIRLPLTVYGTLPGDEDLTTLGFILGPPCEGDELTRHATIPPGWQVEPGATGGWIRLVDTCGRPRVAIHDSGTGQARQAYVGLYNLRTYTHMCVDQDRPIVTDLDWATPEAVAAALEDLANEAARQADAWARLTDPANREHDYRMFAHQCRKRAAALTTNPTATSGGQA